MTRTRKYRYVHITRSKDGKDMVFFGRSKKDRVMLPPLEHPRFHDCYMRAFNGLPLPNLKYLSDLDEDAIKRVNRSLAHALPRARRRATRKGIPFDIDMPWLISEVERQGYRCALTGISFYAKHKPESAKNPFAPSMDQIKPSKGYTRDNVRIVLFAINAMMSDWGSEVFEHVARSYKSAQKENVYSLTLKGRKPHLE